MSVEMRDLQVKLDEALTRLQRLEERMDLPAESTWRFLVSRPHSWRRQLQIKGRNLTVGQLLATMRANLCVYREMTDPWLRQFRDDAENTLFSLMPGLKKLTGDIGHLNPWLAGPSDF